jgi:hypothetical protein
MIEDKQKWITVIDGILKNKKNKISKSDRKNLETLKEEMIVAKTKKNWFKILKKWAIIGGAAAAKFFKDD